MVRKNEHGVWFVVGQKKKWPTKEQAERHEKLLKRKRRWFRK